MNKPIKPIQPIRQRYSYSNRGIKPSKPLRGLDITNFSNNMYRVPLKIEPPQIFGKYKYKPVKFSMPKIPQVSQPIFTKTKQLPKYMYPVYTVNIVKQQAQEKSLYETTLEKMANITSLRNLYDTTLKEYESVLYENLPKEYLYINGKEYIVNQIEKEIFLKNISGQIGMSQEKIDWWYDVSKKEAYNKYVGRIIPVKWSRYDEKMSLDEMERWLNGLGLGSNLPEFEDLWISLPIFGRANINSTYIAKSLMRIREDFITNFNNLPPKERKQAIYNTDVYFLQKVNAFLDKYINKEAPLRSNFEYSVSIQEIAESGQSAFEKFIETLKNVLTTSPWELLLQMELTKIILEISKFFISPVLSFIDKVISTIKKIFGKEDEKKILKRTYKRAYHYRFRNGSAYILMSGEKGNYNYLPIRQHEYLTKLAKKSKISMDDLEKALIAYSFTAVFGGYFEFQRLLLGNLLRNRETRS